MSDLFMNMQRHRRRAWHSHQQPSDAKSNTTTNTRSPIRTRAGTPARIGNALNRNCANDVGDDDDEDNYELDDGENDENQDTLEDDPLANILSLKLRKPSHWKWELTTSKSCTNIALPRILLYDHKGNLLVDAPAGGGNESSEQVYKQDDSEKPRPRDRTKKRPYSHQRAATTNLTHSVRQALEEEFDGLQIEELTPTTPSSTERKITTSLFTTPSSTSTSNTLRPHRSRKAIELNTADLPDISRRSSSLKGVRFFVEDENQSKIPEFLPTPPSTTTPTSSSSGPREKRKYRRSQSSGRSSSRSESILERFSYQKGRFSSPESEDGQGPQTKPRYFLRTDEAGTLIVHEDSFNSQNSRRRRRPHKNASSAENISRTESPHTPALTPSPQPSLSVSPNRLSEASTTPSTRERRRKLLPVRRYLSDGNILLNKHLSTSDEEEKTTEMPQTVTTKQKVEDDKSPSPTPGAGCNCKHHRRYRRNETRDLDASISSVGPQRNGKIR